MFRQTTKVLHPEENLAAEKRIFILSQKESFAEELKHLRKNQNLWRCSRIIKFNPFLGSDNLLRSTGRTSRMKEIHFEVKHPIILDSRHPAVCLLLQHIHQIHLHQGVEYLRSVIQQDYAVLRLRSALRKLESECLFFRRRRAKCLQSLMADLPTERLAYKKPAFTNTGFDSFGPLHVTVRRTTEKRWIIIFTCLTTRAIHLEVLHSLNTSSCMMAIDRFVARRGRPDTFWSDNGTKFVSASKEVNTIETPALQEKCAQRRIKWKFNTPSAPNQGGAWESLIKSCKKILLTVLGSSNVKEEEVLSTSIC